MNVLLLLLLLLLCPPSIPSHYLIANLDWVLDFHANCPAIFMPIFALILWVPGFCKFVLILVKIWAIPNSKDPTTKILPTLQAKILV